MDRAAEYLCHMRTFGHVPDQGVYEPALAAALPLNKRDPVRAPDALAAGRLVGEMLVSSCDPDRPSFSNSSRLCEQLLDWRLYPCRISPSLGSFRWMPIGHSSVA